MADDLMFSDDEDAAPVQAIDHGVPWKVLVVDDDAEVHAITRMVLSDIRFRSRSIEMLSAYSAKEAVALLKANVSIAVILLDVVMETDDAGLRLVQVIRKDLDNRTVRIILRTGQPGQAPERDVILDYDINDYKAKTELTAQKLFTAVVAALRSFEDILIIERNRQGLAMIVDASASLFQSRSMKLFTAGVLTQLDAMLGLDGILCAQAAPPGMARPGEDKLRVLGGSGRFQAMAEAGSLEQLDGSVAGTIARTLNDRRSAFADNGTSLYLRTPNRRELVVYLDSSRPLDPVNRQLVEVFCTKISVGFDNLYLYDQLRGAHEATVVALADLAEYKDTDTGQHVLRVATMTSRIARALYDGGSYRDQIDDVFLDQVGTASILHDVGKVSTPDHILRKPGPLDPGERTVMMLHAPNGGSILERAARMVDGSSYLALGAEIAAHHHEWWDGSGYPRQMGGTAIPLSARIVSVADVFDALTHKRPYKEPWPLDRSVAYIQENAGRQFDPVVVEAFLRVIRQPDGIPPDRPGLGYSRT